MKPELVATEAEPGLAAGTSPSCWGPVKWTYYYLYVILDIYSRYCRAGCVAARRTAKLAEALLADTVTKQGIEPRPAHHPRRPGRLDDVQAGGASAGRPGGRQEPHPPARRATTTRTHEAGFKTLKYRPDFPDRFGCSRTPATSARAFFGGTTTTTATRASACTPRPTSTTAAPRPVRGTGRRPRRRLRRPPRALRPQATGTAGVTCGGVDQQAEGGPCYDTVIPEIMCLTKVDRRRTGHHSSALPLPR